MKRTWFIVGAMALAFELLLTVGQAAAQSSVYVTGFGGVDTPDTETLTGANAAGQARNIDVSFEDGSIYGLAIGMASPEHRFGRVRAELETSSRVSDLEGVVLNDVARTLRTDRDVSVTTGLVQVVYDTPVYFDRVRFHIGAGYGVANVNHNIGYLVANAAAIGSSPGNLLINIPNSETTSARQLVAGAELVLSPRWALTADVRHLDVGDLQAERLIENSIINGVPTITGTLDSILDADYASVSYTIGLRYTF